MKTTLLFLLAGAGVGLGWHSSAHATESARYGALAGTLAAQVGQAKLINRGGESPRDRVDRLLLGARAALEAGKTEAAEKLLVEAEGLHVPYGVFHVGDTPKKLRRDLERAQTAGAGPASPSRTAKPHNPFVPSGMRGAAAEDPFANGQAQADANAPPPADVNDEAGRISRQSVASSKKRSPGRAVVSPDAAAASTSNAIPHSRTASRPARQIAPAGSPGMAPPPDDEQAGSRLAMRARRAAKPTTPQPAPAAPASEVAAAAPATASAAPSLLGARKALAGGDLRRANTLVSAVKRQPPQNLPPGESIEHVEALIKRQQTLRDARAAQGNQITEEIRRDLALLLIDYAQGLMVYGELDDAERLVNDALGLDATMPAGGPQPALVLKQIAQLRTNQLAEPARLVVHEGDVAPTAVTGGLPTDAPPSPAKAQVLSLMARARAAIDARDFGTAEMLLQQAQKISPPAKEFGPGEDRPDLVLRDLHQARANGGVRLASGTQPLPPPPQATSDRNVAHAFYDPRRDTTANAQASADSAAPESGSPFESADNNSGPEWPSDANQQNASGAPAAGDGFAFPEEAGDSPFDAQAPGADDVANPAPNQRESSRRAASPPGAPAEPEAMNLAPPTAAPGNASAAEGVRFYAMGENALQNNDPNTALAFFRKAAEHSAALPAGLKDRLQKHLETLEPMVGGAATPAQYQAGQAGLIAPGDIPGGASNNAIGTATPVPATATPAPPAELNHAGDAAEPKPEEGDANSPGAQPAPAAPQTMPAPVPLPPGGLLGETSAAQRVAIQRLVAEIGKQQLAAKGLKERDPKQALEVLDQAARVVQQSGVDTQTQSQLLARLERTREEVNAYYEANRATIELKENNAATVEQVERERAHKREIEVKLAEMIDNYNKLMDEHRYEEATVVAKQACELAPNNAIAKQLKWNANFVERMRKQNEINDLKEQGFIDQLYQVEVASTPFNDNDPFQFGDKPEWDDMTKRRKALTADRPRRSEAEMQIEQKLKTPVSLEFQEASLSEVLTYLAKLCDINIYLDPQGLAAEGVDSSQKVNVELSKAVMLKSALNIILEPLHLSYVIKDEVLKITSEQVRDGEIVPATYYVADLVIPIPNFVPGPRLGLASSLHDAYGSLGYGGGPGTGFANGPLTTTLMSQNGAPGAPAANGSVLANVGGPSSMASPLNQSANPMLHSAPGGAGGGVVADFDSLIDLITSTIAPTTWEEVGGQGAIESYRNNLSLVISQTEDVHDQIRDLLEQLRKLQDLQVTIEVRFITLNDNFFERIGVDFDFFINRNENSPNQPFGQPDPNFSAPLTGPPITGGFSQGPLRNFTQPQTRRASTAIAGIAGSPGTSGVAPFTADLDLPFTQGSFSAATPPFGPFDANSAANFGFAILSDIEAFFLLQAAQADRRSNVLQAPKVTLFNGQSATVSDTSQSPFVISVIPVVGDFAAAQQPVIVVLNEGVFMTVQATVSNDRRFVRLTVVPFFSTIGQVNTFQFEGSTTTREQSSSDGPENSTTAREQDVSVTRSGTTVQLPTFSFVTVTTTVSVPDGGTVLLGGIKRLREGRNEFGVPMLNKIPYVNRLFSNVGIGRETQSLMMMVTPRIIIQEEEEQLLGAPPTAP